ncbi:MAG: hypothetical protein JKY33_01520 [Bacteroidia bacterium]|nr:hypothetical protein [Bacteroidia bacterium]
MSQLHIELLHDTVNLIIKDFSQFDLEVKFSGNVEGAYEELKAELFPQVEDLVNNNNETLMSILYRIDVNEKKIANLLDDSNGQKYAEVIVDLILDREWQKALTRKYFKLMDEGWTKKDIEKKLPKKLKL